MRIFKKFIVLLLIMSAVMPFTALAEGDEQDAVIIGCKNLRNALAVLTEEDILTEENLGELDGTVDLSSQGITNLEGIEYLIRADKIILSNNHITDISPLYKMEYIKEISVNLNDITEIPVGLSSLKYLRHLDISNNNITSLPSDIGECEDLRWLIMENCGVEDVGNLSGLGDTLEWLNMAGNPQSDYEFFKALPNLELINLNNCNLSKLPDFTSNLGLEYLYVSNNQLTSLPDYLSVYTIKRLDASYNYLSDIPDSYINFARMEQLVLTDNLFREFPVEVLTYHRLRVLMMGYNLLQDVSPGLSVLDDLQRLSFTSNDFTHLSTYSEFKIPYSYQLSFKYNRLNLQDETTQKILEINHNNGGVQKDGSITAQLENAHPEAVEFNINGDFTNFNELKNIGYSVKEVVVLDNASKNLLYIVDTCTMDENSINVLVEDKFAENTAFDWEVILVMSIDTYPVTNLKYISSVSGKVIPVATPTPAATPAATPTPTATSSSTPTGDSNMTSMIVTLVIAGLLILAVVYVCIILIRRHHKKQNK